jgi:di/tricarboxylate transporter
MGTEQLLVAAALVVMTVGLATRRFSPTLGIVGCLLALFVGGISDAETTFGGFSNSAPISIAALYVVAGGVQRTGAVVFLVIRLAGERAFSRVLAGAALASAFVANTPVVAILIGPVIRWADEHGRSPSKFLIPLSYATILGGMTTLIGTSTNLVGSGVATELGQEPLTFFEPARFGLPVAIVGLIMAAGLGSRLLPDRRSPADEHRPEKSFTVVCTVVPEGPYDGATVEGAGLRDLPGLFLVAAQESANGELTAPVGPTHLLHAGTMLSFAGAVTSVVDLQNRPGLELSANDQFSSLADAQHAWYEAVVGNGSPLVGSTIKQAQFRSRYQAAVVALHRSGSPVAGRLGDERIQMGDSLLLVADLGFAQRWNKRSDFLLIRRRSEPPPTASNKAALSLGILAIVVLLTVSGLADVVRAAVIGAGLTVIGGVLTPRQARDAVDLNVVVLIGAAIGLGRITVETGLADRLASGLITLFEPAGAWGVAMGVTLAALLLTELVTNAGAVAITVPIAVASAQEIGADPRAFTLAAVTAASASFLTPIGYQTNTMVYGPGRYHFTDYLRLGLPITLAVVLIVPVLAS